jgi:hypothetical protein
MAQYFRGINMNNGTGLIIPGADLEIIFTSDITLAQEFNTNGTAFVLGSFFAPYGQKFGIVPVAGNKFVLRHEQNKTIVI